MSRLILPVILMVMLVGCARGSGSPVAPSAEKAPPPEASHMAAISDGPYQLWGQWMFYFNAAHDRVDAIPLRTGRFHLNSLKFLEEYCSDCLKIINIKKNWDGTYDLTVRISHPFKGHLEYTGFDVKGILMFNGSYEYPSVFSDWPPYPEPYRISWRVYGDPELLNPDGWTLRWSPSWVSESKLPIFNYWPGKYSMGVPTANLNGFKNFYTHEQRHMFTTDGLVQRTYNIWLPPGEPVVAGYAVEACWAPPTKTPVTDPLNDFPLSANQPEPYLFNLILNNNMTITESPCCGGDFQDCSRTRVECARWDGVDPGMGGNTYLYLIRPHPYTDYIGIGPLFKCSPALDDVYYAAIGYSTLHNGNGVYRKLILYVELTTTTMGKNVVLDVYDFVIDIDQ